MEQLLYRPEPPNAESLWSIDNDQKAGFSLRYVFLTLILLIPTSLTATLGTINLSAPDNTAITHFWPAAAFQIVLPIWFGVYGVIAGVIGPMLGNGLIGESPFMFVPANAFYCCLAGLWFRRFKLDPRLKQRRDWIGLLLVCCVAGNVIGAGLGVFETYLRMSAVGGTETHWQFYAGKFLNWFTGNTLPSIILAPALLLSASSIIVRGPLFCQRFWGGAHPKASMLHHRFNDLPMIVKLLLLILLVSILPISAIATWSILETMKGVDYLAAQVNDEAARGLRNDIERHELILRLWAEKLDRPNLTESQRKALIDQWRKIPDTFQNLELTDLGHLRVPISTQARLALKNRGVAFFPLGRTTWAHLKLYGLARLNSSSDQVLAGEVDWLDDGPLTKRWAAVEGVIVLNGQGQKLFSDVPKAITEWTPPTASTQDRQFLLDYGGKKWNVAEANLYGNRWRFITVSSIKAGQAAILAKVPNPIAILMNLAIFGSLIIGSIMSRQISDRVLAIAQQVYESGAQPGKLNIPIRGRDELGFLGITLNRISGELAENLQKLQITTTEKERLATEMNLASEVQQSILPSEPPNVVGYDIAALSNPAREVGGDFFDFISLADGRIVLMIGDAVGKGLRAAMFVSETHGLAHAAAIEYSTPERILAAINSAIVSSRGESCDFVTLFCTVLDPKQHKLFYASAGHNPPIWKHAGKVETFETGSLPLGIMGDTTYDLHAIDLAQGDMVIMYTDGVTEAQTLAKDLYGTDRLEFLLQNAGLISAEEMNRTILASVAQFVGKASQSDDLTLLTLRRL